MTTAKDLFLIALDAGSARPVGQGDLSLALAGAELIDLLGAGAATLDGDRIAPGGPTAPDDPLMADAAAALDRRTPPERIEDWLWRRGKELSAGYQAALEEGGELTPERSGMSPFGAKRVEPVDSPARQRAAARLKEGDPVLLSLAAAVGVEGERDEEPAFEDGPVATVLAAVRDAVMELEAVRQRRSIENAAFANLWRGP